MTIMIVSIVGQSSIIAVIHATDITVHSWMVIWTLNKTNYAPATVSQGRVGSDGCGCELLGVCHCHEKYVMGSLSSNGSGQDPMPIEGGMIQKDQLSLDRKKCVSSGLINFFRVLFLKCIMRMKRPHSDAWTRRETQRGQLNGGSAVHADMQALN